SRVGTARPAVLDWAFDSSLHHCSQSVSNSVVPTPVHLEGEPRLFEFWLDFPWAAAPVPIAAVAVSADVSILPVAGVVGIVPRARFVAVVLDHADGVAAAEGVA